ncbi:hypothetical protein F3Y22_tig00111708pilonHSYRG00103 [Hibiscus syriacus]|uniref:Uncharacterized protein n=1 Tax=Hibiscus syriacus TaxID=106335 RepID=A0A6A2XH70_HIBSY|nr:hypothetical protein F3Y22_tig00111708pilonHSYRG00103 [Hibiscus syriacus]
MEATRSTFISLIIQAWVWLPSRYRVVTFIERSITALDPSYAELFNGWTRENNLENSSILNYVSKDIAANPLPSISKVFSLIVQEENQRLVKMDNPVVETTFAVKSTHGPRKNHPQCSYCSLLGHMKDKCYKLHGYPP